MTRMTLLGGIVLTAAWAMAQTPATVPAERSAFDYSPDAKLQLKIVQEAKTFEDAQKAYARAYAAYGRDPRLLEAFLTRALEFGRADVAVNPARDLAAIRPEHGLAWSALGYAQARGGQLGPALESYVKARKALPNDAGVGRNLAQLVAWHDTAGKGAPLSEAAAEAVKTQRGAWLKDEAFAREYTRVRDKARAQQASEDQAKDLTREARGDVQQQKRKMDEMEAEFRQLDRGIQQLEESQRELAKDIRDEEKTKPKGSSEKNAQQRRLAQLHDRQRSNEQTLRDYRARRDDMVRKAKVEMDKYKKLQASADRAPSDGVKGDASVYHWAPPLEKAAPQTQPAPGAPAPAADKPADEAAKAKLGMARVYIKGNLNDKARPLLEQVITDWPDSPQAKEAQALLNKIAPPEKKK